MSDDLKELLTDLRATAVHEIRPPGVAAARRTVRRRRVTTLVASACAVLVAVGGAFALLGRPAAELPPVLPAAPAQSLAPGESGRLAAIALAKITDDRPALEVAAPVETGYTRQEESHLRLLTVKAACAGTGEISLLVWAHWQDHDPKDLGTEVARLRVPCGTGPVPVSQDIDVTGQNYLTFQLEEAESAAGRAGFAYRVTGQGSPPVAPGDPRADLERVMGLTNGPGMESGGFGDAYRPSKTFTVIGEGEDLNMGERYTLGLGCLGTGTYHFRVQRGAAILVERSVPCGLPPEPQEFTLDQQLGGDMRFLDRYDGPAGEQAQAGWRLTAR